LSFLGEQRLLLDNPAFDNPAAFLILRLVLPEHCPTDQIPFFSLSTSMYVFGQVNQRLQMLLHRGFFQSISA